MLVSMLALLLALVACLTPTSSPTAAAPTPAPLTPASPTPPAQAPASPTPAVTPTQAPLVFGPGAFIFPDTKAGLADLSSYQATLTLSFDGTEAGTAQHWSKAYVMLSSQQPAARQLTIEKTGDFPDLDAVFMAELDGAAYQRLGQNACDATIIDPANSLGELMEPAGFLTGVIGAEAAGSETVNGVAADHYTFDERAFGSLPPAQSTGELWVASQGGYIVKYLVTTKGNADYFGEGIEGTLSWDYELTNANQPLAIQLPSDCPPGLPNAPQLPDAANIQNVPGLLTYDTASSLADDAAFYQAQLPPLGWTLMGDPILTDTTALLDFTQSGKQLTIIITTGEAGTTVTIELGSASPSPGGRPRSPERSGAGGPG